MYVIGLTGGIGTGKTTVARMFADLGAQVISADKIVHDLIQPQGTCYPLIIKAFGRDILSDGKIDRRRLAAMVFENPRKLKKLENIIHPHVRREIERALKACAKHQMVVLEVPLLFEAGFDRYADLLVVVNARREQQVQRAGRALGLSAKEVQKRIQAQMPLKDKELLADVVIDNAGSLTATRKQVKNVWKNLKENFS